MSAIQTVVYFLGALAIGASFGVFLEKSKLCYASMLSDFFLIGSSRHGSGVIIATLLTMFSWSVIYAIRGAQGFWVPAYGIYSLVGGFIFGLGMIIASGCVTSTLYRVASGRIQYVITLLFMCVGYLTYGLLYPVIVDNYFIPLYLGSGDTLFSINRSLSPIIVLGIALAVVGVYSYYIGKKRKEIQRERASGPKSNTPGTSGNPTSNPGNSPGTNQTSMFRTTNRNISVGYSNIESNTRSYFSHLMSVSLNRKNLNKILKKSWDPRISGVGIALTATIWLIYNGVWTVSGPESQWVVYGVDFLGLTTSSLQQWESALYPLGKAGVTLNMMMIMGILIGAGLSAYVSGNWGLVWPEKEVVPYSVSGGFLMGIGSRIAPGCNIANMFTGIAQLSIHGIIASVGIVMGAYIAYRALY